MRSPSAIYRLVACVPLLAVTVLVDAAHGAGPTATHAPATEVCGPLAGDTRWTVQGSPYEATCDVEVPDGITLTIDAGVTVRLNQYNRLSVAGALMVQGTAASPVTFEAVDPTYPWESVQLLAGSGPSQISHAVLKGGGAGRREMLGIASDDVSVSETLFTEGAGIAVAVTDGASPTIAKSHFLGFQDRNPNPPAALTIRGPSDLVVTGCVFESNIYAIFMDGDVSPTFEGNRFLYNGHDGVLWYGETSRDVTVPSLGPRTWAYELKQTGVTVADGTMLTILPGATLEFDGGTGIRVAGTLSIRGEATNKVLLTSNLLEPSEGKWNEIEFQPQSRDYHPETDQGSIIDHAIIEYSGAKQTGALYIRNTSPRISNTTIRESGRRAATVVGEEAAPQFVATFFDGNDNDPDGIGVFAEGAAAPEISFSHFRNNLVGVRSERGGSPVVESHNWFERNLSYAVNNADRTVCVEATGNDWGGFLGPSDRAEIPTDACGVGKNEGDGDRVSNHVRYSPFEGQIARPTILRPFCGTLRETSPAILGLAPAGSTVEFYDNQEPIGSTTAESGSEEMAPFTFSPPHFGAGSHVIHARAILGDLASGISEPLELLIDPELIVDPDGLYVSYDLDDTHYVQPYLNASGCRTLRSGDWIVRPHPPDGPITLHAPISCPSGATPTAEMRYGEDISPLQAVGGEAFEGQFSPGEGGSLSLRVTCGSEVNEITLGTVLIEYNGMVYDEAKGQHDGRIMNAKVTLEVWDRASFVWKKWNGEEYFGQTNPQITGLGGWYAFYPQPGYYRVRVTHTDYEGVVTEGLELMSEPFVENIALQRSGGLYLPVLLDKFSW